MPPPVCNAEFAIIFKLQDGKYHVAASNNADEGFVKYASEHPIPPGRGSMIGRAALTGKTVHIPDCLADPEYTFVEYHFAEDLRYFASKGASSLVVSLTEAAYWALPHLELFNARGLAVHGVPVAPERLAFATAYALLYLGGVLVLAGTIFRRREFR